MKRNLILVSAIVLATLTSCTKDSELDPTIESAMNAQIPISFSTYASSATATKGTAIDSNKNFQEASTHGSFDVAALASECDCTLDYGTNDGSDAVQAIGFTMSATGDGVKFFSLNTWEYNEGWGTTTNNVYWPNSSRVMHFAACSPSGVIEDDNDYTFSYNNNKTNKYTYSFDYFVTDVIESQIDLMYALTSVNYISPSDQNNQGGTSLITTGVTGTIFGDTNDEDAVNLHFKHALTQIAFSATKDSNIEVYVKGITICNVYNSGVFTATKLTDDSDSSTNKTDSETVGDTTETGDLVDASNFGSWETYFDEDGWGTLSTEVKDSHTSYYTTEGSGGHLSMSNYATTFNDYSIKSPTGSGTKYNSIKIDDTTATALTSSSEVLMLMPQSLQAWVPTTSTEPNFVYYINTGESTKLYTDTDGNYMSSTADNSLTYLAIDCEIYNSGAVEDSTTLVHDGYLFMPFETKDIDYSSASVDNAVTKAQDAWLPGYKITYCLNFGGGYIVDEDNHTTLPEPGCIPDTDTYTLRSITYTTSVDTFVDGVDGATQELGDYDTSDASDATQS